MYAFPSICFIQRLKFLSVPFDLATYRSIERTKEDKILIFSLVVGCNHYWFLRRLSILIPSLSFIGTGKTQREISQSTLKKTTNPLCANDGRINVIIFSGSRDDFDQEHHFSVLLNST